MPTIKSLSDFLTLDSRKVPAHLDILQRDISGGKTSLDDLRKIEKHPNVETIRVSGLDQDVFERFISEYGNRFRGIFLWKCPKISNLAALAELKRLEYLAIFWNQRAETLWDMRHNKSLRGVSLMDFSRLHRLDCLSTAPSLEEVEFGDAVWDGLVLETLGPLARCKRLRSLEFTVKTLVDGRIEPLAAIPSLKKLQFPGKLFMAEQVAWLKARLGSRVACKTLAPYWTIDKPIEMNGKQKDTFIVGKRMPFLASREDAKKIATYVASFNAMVKRYAEKPDLAPPANEMVRRKTTKTSTRKRAED